MPKTPRKAEKIREIKKRILDQALNIINKEGINNLSMRKLAAQTDMSAANLYNYYKSKEIIINALDNRGFDLLANIIKKIANSEKTPIEKLKASIRKHVEFGTNPERVHQYNIMFNRARTSDYSGIKGLAEYTEYKTRKYFRILDLCLQNLHDCVSDNPKLHIKDPKIMTMRIWIEVYGIVTFHNNRLLNELKYSDNFHEFAEDPKKTVHKLTEALIDSIISGDL